MDHLKTTIQIAYNILCLKKKSLNKMLLVSQNLVFEWSGPKPNNFEQSKIQRFRISSLHCIVFAIVHQTLQFTI